MSHELWAAYLTTVVDVALPDGTRRLLEQVPVQSTQDWPFDETIAWILTACNPRSVVLSPEVNAARHEQMGRDIDDLGLTAYPNLGYDPADPTWNEAGYTIVGSDEATVCDLAREWEQNAVFRWAPEGFELVGVLMPGRDQHGWRWIS
ncbi:MAG: hypothetical protein RL134_1962 [Actinomycetota bacterium]|jgi:hypothetical protein